MKARRSPWLNGRTALLLARLGEYELTLPEDLARQFISDHLDSVAEPMRIGRQAARYYVTEEVTEGTGCRAGRCGIAKRWRRRQRCVVAATAEEPGRQEGSIGSPGCLRGPSPRQVLSGSGGAGHPPWESEPITASPNPPIDVTHGVSQ
jgi:hypothetical protein